MTSPTNDPAPIPPLPNARQLAWHEDDLTVFVHFGMNSYTGLSTGKGNEDPDLFCPSELDCEQWVLESKKAGFKGLVLTAKHHDGFCLWPTKTTDHSVSASSWRDGKGDVMREFADACHKHNMKCGIYCSPWDIYQGERMDPEAYTELFLEQLRELLTGYGPIYEMWFDGNNAKVPEFERVINLVRELQPGAIIKEGPRLRPVSSDVRWVGNERACCRLANWCVFPEPGEDSDHEPIWFPVETDTPMVGDWFWADTLPLDMATLMNFYYTSVGRGSIFLMNIAPNRAGVFDENSVERVHEYADAIRGIYDPDYAREPGAKATASQEREGCFAASNVIDGNPDTYWATNDGAVEAELVIDLGKPQEFNVIRLEEPIRLGQRVARYELDVWDDQDAEWGTVNTQGYTIGRRKLDRIPRARSSKIRLRILEARACPLIQSVGVHLDEVSPAEQFEPDFANTERPLDRRRPHQDPLPTE